MTNEIQNIINTVNKRGFLTLFLLLGSLSSIGQSKLGSWNAISVNLKINEKWNFFAETQIRSLSFYDEFHY